MTKTAVNHKSWRLEPGAPSCDVFMPKDKGLQRATREQYGSFFIAAGLGSIKTDYEKFGKSIASKGFTVYSANFNEGLPTSTIDDALERRAEILTRSIEKWGGDGARIIPHSLGGPVTMLALLEMGLLEKRKDKVAKPATNGKVLSVSFMQPAGFADHSRGSQVSVARFMVGEVLPRTMRLIPGMIRGRGAMYERMDIRQRAAEVKALRDLPPDFMANCVAAAHENGIPMGFFLGPKDRLTEAAPIRSTVAPIVGMHNVIDIHEEAGHLAAQTHASHTARLILGHLDLHAGYLGLAA